jgi:hypothetical protein
MQNNFAKEQSQRSTSTRFVTCYKGTVIKTVLQDRQTREGNGADRPHSVNKWAWTSGAVASLCGTVPLLISAPAVRVSSCFWVSLARIHQSY